MGLLRLFNHQCLCVSGSSSTLIGRRHQMGVTSGLVGVPIRAMDSFMCSMRSRGVCGREWPAGLRGNCPPGRHRLLTSKCFTTVIIHLVSRLNRQPAIQMGTCSWGRLKTMSMIESRKAEALISGRSHLHFMRGEVEMGLPNSPRIRSERSGHAMQQVESVSVNSVRSTGCRSQRSVESSLVGRGRISDRVIG